MRRARTRGRYGLRPHRAGGLPAGEIGIVERPSVDAARLRPGDRVTVSTKVERTDPGPLPAGYAVNGHRLPAALIAPTAPAEEELDVRHTFTFSPGDDPV